MMEMPGFTATRAALKVVSITKRWPSISAEESDLRNHLPSKTISPSQETTDGADR